MTTDVPPGKDLLELTLAAASKDVQTTEQGGIANDPPMPHGMRFHETQNLPDARGQLVEVFDTRWGWHDDPFVQGYVTTMHPGVVKGWGLHKTHEDRYFLVAGKLELVTYDPRPASPTAGLLSRLVLTADRPRIINIPRFVWHADHNIGTTDAVLLNFPTVGYDHRNPDKYRLPLDTPLIPHDFGRAVGW